MENNHFALLEFENVRKINFSRFNFQWWRPPTSDAIVVMYALNRYSHSPPSLTARAGRREASGEVIWTSPTNFSKRISTIQWVCCSWPALNKSKNLKVPKYILFSSLSFPSFFTFSKFVENNWLTIICQKLLYTCEIRWRNN